MHLKSLVRPLAASVVASLMLTTLAPMAPRAEPGPVKVRAAETTVAVTDTHDFEVSPESTHVAIHWAGHPDAIVTASLSTDGTTFSEPEAVDIEDSDDGPDGAPTTDETYGALIRVDGIREVRVHTDRLLAKLTVLALNAAGPEPMPLGLGAEADGGTTLPGVISRSAWGADESLRFDAAGDEQWTREYHPVQKLVVHHTAGRNGDPDPAATVRAIYYYHAVTRRWADIGYNYLIDEAGRVYEGRYARDFWNGATPSSDNEAGLGIAAGHTKYYNQGTLAVALLGNFDLQAPTAAAHASLVRMLAWASAKYHIDPTASGLYVNPVSGVTGTQPNIAGHRDYAATSCPGGFLYAQLPSLRNEVAAQVNGWPGEIFNPQRTLFFVAGTYTGRTFSATGAVTATKTLTLSGASSAPTDQSSIVPTQSGQWYSVTAGVWAGYWIQQSAGITLSAAPSAQTRTSYETARPVSVPAGTYVGRRFDTYGSVTASKSSTMSAGSTIWATEKSTIPNQAGNWYYVTVGALEGYWVPEVAGMSLGPAPPPLPVPIAVYNPARQLLISPGTYVGRRFSQYAISAGTYTATLTSASSAPTSRYSTLPGQSGNWYYIVDGVFESYWLLESPGLKLAPGPSPSTTDFVFDATGYFVPDPSGASYVPLTPARLLDSRFGNGLSDRFSANTPRTFQVSGRGGVPANAVAVTGNFTVTNQTSAGAAFPGSQRHGQPQHLDPHLPGR